MRKLWILAFKEVRLTFRDTGALVMMLLTPLALTLAIGAAFGGDSGLSNIPVLVINHDTGILGANLVETLGAASTLLDVTEVQDEADARAQVADDAVAALIVLPADLSARVAPMLGAAQEQLGLDLTTVDTAELSTTQQIELALLYTTLMARPRGEPAEVEIYASPRRSISTAVVRGVVGQCVEQLSMTTVGINAIMQRLFQSTQGATTAGFSAADFSASSADSSLAATTNQDLPIHVRLISPSGHGFNWLDYSAVSMAVFFLMFTVSSGGRTFLAEREGGTLPRLLITPTPARTLLLGKMSGTVLTGILQMVILWIATSFIGAWWGAPLGVMAGIITMVLCAAGVGALISAWAKTPGQAGAIGNAVTLIGAAVSGSFYPRDALPLWVQNISLITPNAWGIQIFQAIQLQRPWNEVLPLLGGALLLGTLCYGIALIGFRRQFAR